MFDQTTVLQQATCQLQVNLDTKSSAGHLRSWVHILHCPRLAVLNGKTIAPFPAQQALGVIGGPDGVEPEIPSKVLDGVSESNVLIQLLGMLTSAPMDMTSTIGWFSNCLLCVGQPPLRAIMSSSLNTEG